MAEMQRVIVVGATGLVGKALCRELQRQGYAVVVFSRNPSSARSAVPGAVEYIAWQSGEPGPWAAALEGAYAVVNLAGASIAGKRWSERYKREILQSRVIGTRGLVSAMAQAQARPQVLINSSGVGYYGYRGDTPLTEEAASGDSFLAQVCVEWEREAARAEAHGVRVVLLRTGTVLDRREGALPQLALPFKFFVGGPILPGSQWLSWIHLEDMIGIIVLALRDERARGPINATAPEPQTNRDFSRTLARVLRRPALFPVPGFAVRLVAGELASELTHGQRVLPKKAQELGYQFQYPTSAQALRQLLRT